VSTVTLPTLHEVDADRPERYCKAAERIQQWSREDHEYDERVGQLLAEELKDSALRCEDRDAPAA
jgi:hypothetical protein